MRPETLGGFVLRTFLWMPVCFAAWYAGARYHAIVAGTLARAIIEPFGSNLVASLEQSGFDLEFVTRIAVRAATGESAVLVPEVNPLLYTYGLAFFAALMLAARAKWWKIVVGALVLLPFQAWGIAFDFLVQVGVKVAPEISAQAGLVGWRREFIALGYQLGSLIFPTLMPVLLWAGFNRSFIGRALRSKREPVRDDGGDRET